MSFKTRLFKIGLPILIVIAGFAIMRILVVTRTLPKKTARSSPGALVEVLSVAKVNHPVEVSGTGTVQARREASITPQVSGRVIWIAPNFIAGGFFRTGDLLFQIEKVDYRLAVDRARAALAQAELELAEEESKARIAREEWKKLAGDKEKDPDPLVLHEPQLRKARAGVVSARAALRRAELDLKRTALFAPFNCRIRSETIGAGQYVGPGAPVATVAGTDTAEIVVPLPLEELHWLSIPRRGSKKSGSLATVRLVLGNRTYTRPGKIVRSLGEVDPLGRMTRVVVDVEDPYHLKTRRLDGEPDLESGMFVEVVLHGEVLKQVIPIPRRALRQESTVWIADDSDRLRIRKVQILRRERDTLLIGKGLANGDRLVLTTLPGAADSMKLRPVSKGTGK